MIEDYVLAPSWNLSPRELEAIDHALVEHKIKKGMKVMITGSSIPEGGARDSRGRFMKTLCISDFEEMLDITVYYNDFEHRSTLD
ncbi:MAG: hypothetical protein AAB734_02365 [Patescibacteria group bacterium]